MLQLLTAEIRPSDVEDCGQKDHLLCVELNEDNYNQFLNRYFLFRRYGRY